MSARADYLKLFLSVNKIPAITCHMYLTSIEKNN